MSTVVLVHGLFGAFGDERLWSRLRPHRVLAPDLLGYGENQDCLGPVTIDGQVAHLRDVIGGEEVVLVGHSVGWVTCVLYASRYPDDVSMLIDVEGNFTLRDAFWSAQLARKPEAEGQKLLETYRANPEAWFGGTADEYEIQCARAALAFQPARTLHAMASSVVAVTGAADWDPTLRELFIDKPVHLVAGEASRLGWDVPGWALDAAQSYVEIPGAAHMMFIQRPEALGDSLASLLQ